LNKSFKIIVITPEKFFENEIYFLGNLFAANLGLLHVRKPGFSKEELTDYLNQIPKRFYKRIILHAHFELVKTFKLKGAHLAEKTRKSVRQINFLNKNKIKIISASFHNLNEIKRCSRKYEYVFLSPVFNSISKNNYKSRLHLETLKPFLKKNKNNIVALGGICDKNIGSVKISGFSGAATVGYVWESKNPVKNYKKLLSKIK